MSNKEKKKQEAAKREVQAEEARKLKAEKAAREAKAMRDSGIQMVDDGTDLTEGSANPNRKNGADGEGQWASGIDAAIGSLSLKGGRGGGGGGAEEKHPEKRLKAVSARWAEGDRARTSTRGARGGSVGVSLLLVRTGTSSVHVMMCIRRRCGGGKNKKTNNSLLRATFLPSWLS
ncbi:unnamed protein product [Pylaiella littoralis]